MPWKITHHAEGVILAYKHMKPEKVPQHQKPNKTAHSPKYKGVFSNTRANAQTETRQRTKCVKNALKVC